MVFNICADIIVLLHFTFILFVIFGGFLVLRYKCLAWLHVPTALYGVAIELFGWICPLTPLENWLRECSGEMGYKTSFIEHYLVPIIYPDGLTDMIQIIFGILVLIVNISIYTFILSEAKTYGTK